MLKRALIIVLGLSLLACGKSEGGKEGEGAEGAEGSGPKLTEQSVELKQKDGGREFTFKTTAKVPEGWTKNEQKGGTTRFQPADSRGFSGPWLAVHLDCGGQCAQDKLLGNIEAMAKTANKMMSRMKIARDEKVKEGTWVYVLEDGQEKNAKIMHWKKGWPRIVTCEIATNKDTADLLEPLVKACTEMKVTVLDPFYPEDILAKEEANLAKCPKKSSLTYKALKADEKPAAFGELKSTYAHGGSYGPGLALYFANFETKQKRFSKKKVLKEGQNVAEFRFSNKTEKGQPQKPAFSGDYALQYASANRVSINLKIANGSSLGWSSRSAKGGVKIIARTKTKLCGTVDISGGNRGALKGEFVVDIL